LWLLMVLGVLMQLRTTPLLPDEARRLKEREASLKSDDPDRVYAAAVALVEMRHVRAATVLSKALKEGSALTRLKVVKAIGANRRDVEADIDEYLSMLSPLIPTGDANLHRELVRTLVAVETPRTCAFLLERLKRDADATAEGMIAEAFGGMELADMDEIRSAVEAAGGMKTKEHAEQVLSAVNDALLQEFRSVQEARRWLDENRSLSYAQAVASRRKELRRREMVRRRQLQSQIHDKIEILRVLARHAKEEAINFIVGYLRDDDEPVEVKEFCLRQLGGMKVLARSKLVVRYLKAEEEVLRVAAAEALAEMGAEGEAGNVAGLLDSSSARERLAAVNAMIKLKFAPAEVISSRLEKEQSPQVLAALVDAVAALKISGAFDALVARTFERTDKGALRLAVKDESLRNKVAEAVRAVAAAVDRKKAIKVLLVMLSDGQAGVRFSACDALGRLKAGEAEGALLKVVKTDAVSGVRAAAIRALAAAGPPSAAVWKTLLETVGGKEKEVSAAALDAVRRLCGVVGETPLDLTRLSKAVEWAAGAKNHAALQALLLVPKEKADALKNEDRVRFAGMLLYLARSHRRRGEQKEAQDVYRRALSELKGELKGRVLMEMAAVLADMGRFAESLERYREAHVLLPERRAEIWERRLDVIERVEKEKKDPKAARQFVESAVEQARKEPPPTEDAKKRLAAMAARHGLDYKVPKPRPPAPKTP